MKHSFLSAHIGLAMMGIVATAALLLEASLPVAEDIHFLLQLLWLGIAMGSLFVMLLHPQNDYETNSEIDDVPEWHDPDRMWMQDHPHEQYLANDIGREET